MTQKVALITGSTSGIGLSIAMRLAQSGHNIILNGFGDPQKIQWTANSIAEMYKIEVVHSNADMTKPDEIEKMIHMAQNSFGSLDIVVCNAGVQHVAPIDEFPPEKWDMILAINLTSAFHVIHHALPLMKEKKWGRIINIASAHALVASPFKSAYVAAKHGLAGLTKTVALEVAEHGITCNAICPGYVQTPLVDNQIQDTAKARGISPETVIRDVILGSQPTKEFVKVEDIAELAAYLSSDHAAAITGTMLSIDGGWTAH
ncbi:3-hydroxybutyrate dehydrogenase [Candidatus Paracaedibacter symbiosus]|uniref:3-hydroxybutyrate dehydrogenase n=1 Tax=Candidatus Paracaedibacter symbiosus TaxID=244582 RepID=UPI000509B162|nr:3-hydroxybutyrate dehydrogenase [Candidatus Paracaedibacter symbiosus]